MKTFYVPAILFVILSVIGCKSQYPEVPPLYHSLLDSAMIKAGDNSSQLIEALNSVPASQKEAMAYLIAYMPDYDLKTISSELLTENVKYAYIAREKFAWCRSLPDSVFFNEVLPYHNVTESRDNWRKSFYDRFSPYINKCNTIEEAIYSVNKNIIKELGVEYSTKRRVSDQGPFESVETKIASCTGLTILLVDAFRSVGIPARFAGTANWFDNRGNHSWCEVLIDGKWYFTEYYMDDLNDAWFIPDAAKATTGSINNGIFAVSYKPTGRNFPLIWDESKPVNALEVTPRYIEICSDILKNRQTANNTLKLEIEAFSAEGYNPETDNRIPVGIKILKDGEEIATGTTSGITLDLNNRLSFPVNQDTEYIVIATFGNIRKQDTIKVGSEDLRHHIIMK